MEIRIFAHAAELNGADLGSSAAVVIDVLRATSTIAAALAAGAARVQPVLTPEESQAAAARGGGRVLGGERGGLRISGFHLGNSPQEYTAERVAGREVILTTTNGTRTLLLAAGAASLCTASFLNLGAVAGYLAAQNRDVAICCAGTHDRFSLDDGLCAGALTARLLTLADAQPCDLGLGLAELYRLAGGDNERLLSASRHGRRLAALGMGSDVAFCAREDVIGLVPVWRDGWLEPQLPGTDIFCR